MLETKEYPYEILYHCWIFLATKNFILESEDFNMQNQIEQTLTSLEVAEMIGKRHDNLIADIREYLKEFSLLNFQERDYFQESTYRNRGKEYPCYKITKKGCEFVAHKLTGLKGTEFTVKYIDRFHDMEETIKESIPEKQPTKSTKKKNLSAVNMMIKNVSDIFTKAGVDPLYIAVATKNIYEEAGYSIPIQLTTKEKKLYDCTEMAKELGILSKTGKPHDKAVSGILQQIEVLENEKVTTPFARNGHDDVTVQYKESVFLRVKQWLIDNNYPAEIPLRLSNGNTNKCKVTYKNVEVA